MALTLTTDVPTGRNLHMTSGGKRYQLYSFVFDNSYPAGGYPITPRQVGLKVIQGFLPFNSGICSNLSLTTCVIVHFDLVASKLMVFWGNAGIASDLPQVPDTTDLSGGFGFGGHAYFVGY